MIFLFKFQRYQVVFCLRGFMPYKIKFYENMMQSFRSSLYPFPNGLMPQAQKFKT